jgi:hypothetical protein
MFTAVYSQMFSKRVNIHEVILLSLFISRIKNNHPVLELESEDCY